MRPTELLQQVEDFIAARGWSPSRFGQQAVGDPNFVFGLRAGREPRFSTVDKVLTFIASQPEDAARLATGLSAGADDAACGIVKEPV